MAVACVACTDSHLVYVARYTEPACAPSSITCPNSKPGDSCSHEGSTCIVDCSVETLVCTQVPDEKCTGGTAGTPSPAGGCCSEWIACADGLSCVPQGPVYPGSLGICVAPPS